MNLGTYDITIDFSKLFFHNNTSIYFKEGDLNTAKVRAKLTMQRKVINITGCNVVVKIETTTGRKINDVATIVDATNGIIEIDFKSNSLIEGTNFFELKIVKGESVKESAKLAYRVLDSIEDAGSIEGTNEYPILVQLIRDVNKAIANADRTLNIATDMQSDLDATINKANTAIANAKDATDKANESVENINRAIASGTQDLEVKAAREDMDGVVHDTLKERLENDLKIGSKSLKQEVLDLSGLKEVQEMSYSADKGYLVCKEAKNGAIKDLKISGKSLVNKIGKFNSLKWVNNSIGSVLYYGVKVSNFNLEIGKEYTIKVFGFGSNVRDDRIIISNVNEGALIHGSDYTFKFTVNTFDSVTDGFIHFYCKGDKTIVQSDYENAKILLLEGDHTQNPPACFEGIASVGTGVDKIEVSSRKEDGNLLNVNDFVIDDSSLYGYIQVQRENKDVCLSLIEKDASVDISGINLGFTGNGLNAKEGHIWKIDKGVIKSNITSTYNFVSFYPKTKETIEKILKRFDIMVNKGTSPIPYQPCKQDKKPLLFKDVDSTWKPIKELRGLDTVCDTVELHSDGKYYYHQRTGKITLNGSEDWLLRDTLAGVLKFRLNSIDSLENSIVICDKFKSIKHWSLDEEHIYCGDKFNKLLIFIDKTKLNTQDVNGFKKWLQANNVTVIYPLAEEKVFEVNPLFLEAFEGETSVFVNGGVINAPIEFKIASYITNLVLLNQQRISLIEQEMFNMFKQVLSGDMYSLAEKLYPEDFIEEDRPMLLI